MGLLFVARIVGMSSSVPPASAGAEVEEEVARSVEKRYSSWAVEALRELPDSFLITDPSLPGHPIVFASAGFLAMSGYAAGDVLGRNAKVFQGPGTCRRAVSAVREAIRSEAPVEVAMLNYRRDGSPVRILLRLCPVFGRDDGQVKHFVGAQVLIAGRRRWSGKAAVLAGSCRREMCLKSSNGGFDLDHVDFDNRGESEGLIEASELEKERAAATVNNVLSTLTHYSEVIGKPICGQRCSSIRNMALSSALRISLGRIKQSFVLTDPSLPDMPIVYASDAFTSLTGYHRDEVLGRNCRFLCGTDTDVEASCQIHTCIQASKNCSVRILNYRKDGSSFWNLLHISPVRNATGKIAFFVGVQMDESSNYDEQGLSPHLRQLGAVGAVKVAIRSLSTGAGPSSS
uniref:Putative LOV domain-containing protein n=1 Tax=Peperomia fraseri TaxID=352176 RepID=A0A126X3U8_9MAGN|nr:putative LOV domain-containing protein [Peperomia fraseri]